VSGVKGRNNGYRCSVCGGLTVTAHVDEGVTPFMLDCRASGQEGDCPGMAQSLIFRLPPDAPEPAWEWYRASKTEMKRFRRDDPAMFEHCSKGGLLIRARKAVPV
jgi:hypothetical protein